MPSSPEDLLEMIRDTLYDAIRYVDSYEELRRTIRTIIRDIEDANARKSSKQ